MMRVSAPVSPVATELGSPHTVDIESERVERLSVEVDRFSPYGDLGRCDGGDWIIMSGSGDMVAC